jgi:hypothetical protein
MTIVEGTLIRLQVSRPPGRRDRQPKTVWLWWTGPDDQRLDLDRVWRAYLRRFDIERGWRDLKQIIDLRPIFHRREDRIRAHVLLCWLALLLIRVAETRTGHTWNRLREQLQRLHLATFTGSTGTYRQTSEPTKPQRDIYTALDLPLPKKIIDLTANA